MKIWSLSQKGDKWTVTLEILDLGGHLDITFRSWTGTLASRVRPAIQRLILVAVLPLDSHERIRVLRTLFITGNCSVLRPLPFPRAVF